MDEEFFRKLDSASKWATALFLFICFLAGFVTGILLYYVVF